MTTLPKLVLLASLLAVPTLRAGSAPDAYVAGPDSVPQAGIPVGDLIKFEFSGSRIFPGTSRTVTVYVPRQYDPAKPACVFVDQDGVQWNAPVVLDNLISRHEVPVIIGVFVTPGIVAARNPTRELNRFNRSFEYDGLGDAYGRFILDELLPEVEKKATPDGRPVHLSHDGNDRSIGGSSSGAIAAFTTAWEHPDAFSRVLSSIGTYVGLRGGDRYPTLVREYEPRPLRIFLQDGSGDLNIYGGDWWMANQTMERALAFAGYEVNHAWGDGGHTGKQMGSILPEALRWLWKDWPKPIAPGKSKNGALGTLLVPGESWQTASKTESGATRDDVGTDVVSGHNGTAYRLENDAAGGTVWRIGADGSKQCVDSGLKAASAITLSPDQSLLYVADGTSHWVYSYQILPDGTLSAKQRYFWLHSDDLDDESHAAGMCCDRSGWLYVASVLGVQVCDQAGRVNAILPLPGGAATSVRFGGEHRDTLIVACGKTIYTRKLNTTGVDPASEPVLPLTPRL